MSNFTNLGGVIEKLLHTSAEAVLRSRLGMFTNEEKTIYWWKQTLLKYNYICMSDLHTGNTCDTWNF